MRRASRALVLLALVGGLLGLLPAPGTGAAAPKIRVWKIHYRTHLGTRSAAYVLLPSWYGPRNHPPIPLVISPHGRGLTGRQNAAIWGSLPAHGPFAVVNPDGQGRIFSRYSWGSTGQINDLARMPSIVERTLPWLHVDHTRIYAFGGSMGGQESLLLLALYPRLLAGAAVFDSVTDLRMQYHEFPHLACNQACRQRWRGSLGTSLQSLARREIGGTPRARSTAFARRSPVTYARRIALSCVPIQFWWSNADRIVIGQERQSGRLFRKILALNPDAPVQAFTGFWIHTREMRAASRLPFALANFELLPERYDVQSQGLHHVPLPDGSPLCRQEG